MRRALACVVAAVVALAPLTSARASSAEEHAYEAQARASVLFSDVDVQPQFDPAFADSRSSGSTIGTTSLDSDLWPGFLVDAFFFLYGFQSVERVGLGVAEARYPQGPTSRDATLSNLAFTNGGDPKAVPASGGHSTADAGAHGASGASSLARITLPVGTIAAASSASSVETQGRAHAQADQALSDIVIGPLRIESIHGTAVADAGGAPASDLHVAGATVNGTPVTIDRDGVRAQTHAAQDAVDGALAGSGILVRIVPGGHGVGSDGGITSDSGGVLVGVTKSATDPTGTPRNIELGLLLGSATAYARAGIVGVVPPPRKFPPAPVVLGEIFRRPSVTMTFASVPHRRYIHRRIVITATTTGLPASARTAYLALVLLGFGLLLVRPLVRAAARP